MADIEVSRVIAAPAEQLYDMVSDLPRMGEWSPENQGGSWIKGAAGAAVGARFQGVNVNGRKKWSTTCRVEQADRGKAFAFHVSVGPFRIARWSYAFQSADGGTKVTETWTDQRNWFAKTVGGKASGVTDRLAYNRTGMETTLANLAGAVER